MISLGQILVPSLLPLATAGGGKVDFAAHVGGAVAGASPAASSCSPGPRRPRSRVAAKVAAAIAAAALV